MSGEVAEVKIKLVMDDAAHATGQRVQQNMSGISDKTHQASSEMQMLNQVGGAAMSGLLVATAGVTAAIAAMGYGSFTAFESALDEARAVKSLTGSLAMMSPGASFEAMHAEAGLLREDLKEMGVQAGVSADAVGTAFETVAARSNKTVAEVEKLTGEMAQVGKVVPGGVSALSEGFANIEAGVIRARNPIVMLVAQSGLLAGNAKQVAAEMSKMTPDKQMEIAEKAIEKMSERVKKLPMGFDELSTSLKDIKDNVLESMGKPILEAVTRVMGDIRTFFMEHREQIAAVASAIGTRIGEFIEFMESLWREMVTIFSDESSEVGADMTDAMEWAADEWDDIKNNAHALAQSFKDIYEMIKAGMDTMITAMRVGAGIMTLGASELFIAEADAGYSYLKDYMGMGKTKATTASGAEIDQPTQDALAKANKQFEKMNVEAAKLDKAADAFRKVAHESNLADAEIEKMVADLYTVHSQAVSKAGGAGFDEAAKAAMSDSVTGAEQFKAAWVEAAKAHNTELMKYGAGVLEHSGMLAEELRASGILVGDGMQDLGSYIKDSALKTAFHDKMKSSLSDMAANSKGATLNMNGGQTFHIKQDFRDQDPERVALTFMDDVKNAAINRTQSKFATPFGL